MRPITDLLSNSPSLAVGQSGNPDSVKTTPEVERVAQDELEVMYIQNPMVFNSINKLVQTIMSSEHYVEAKDEKVQKFFDKFIKNVGRNSDLTWEGLLSDIFKHQFIYGRAFIENIFNKKGNRIVDWDKIDPKKMDYAKDSDGNIVLDKTGQPVGYFELVPASLNSNIESTPESQLPENVDLPMNQKAIFFEPEKLAHLKLYSVGDGFYGIGLIEPIYQTSLRKLNIERALANAIYRHGFPIIWAQLGDMNHEPTPQQLQNMLDRLKGLSNKNEIATPYYHQLNLLESKTSEKMKEHLDYFRKQEVAGMGVPEPFITGSAEGANFATLGKQDSMFQLTLNDLIRRTTEAIERYMFAPICELEGFNEVPKLKWEVVGSEELNNKAQRLVEYVKSGVLDPNNVQDFVRKIEQLENPGGDTKSQSKDEKDSKTSTEQNRN